MKISNWPYFDSEQINAVTKILNSGKVNAWTGDECKLFEKEFAHFSNSKYAIAMANGSLALWAAYRAIGIKKDDEIITTPRTFIATTSSALLLGAKPIFADVDRDSGAITPETIEPLINKKTKAISVVHLGGWPADMESISKLAKVNNLSLIEDCSQAHGAFISGKSVGSFGDISTWSFCQDKIISTGGEGGMITTSNETLYNKLWSYKDHGKTLEAIKKANKGYSFKWLHEELGSNFRLTEMQSAIGRIQLRDIKNTQSKREQNAYFLASFLSDIECIRIPIPKNNLIHAWYKFYVFLNREYLNINWTRDRIISEISERGFPAFSGSCSEIYKERCISNLNLSPKVALPIAKELGDTSLMFLVDQTIEKDHLSKYAEVIKETLIKASS